MRQIVLDTETTGLQTADGHRIIEIGCIEIVNRKITPNRFHHYLNPERLIDEEASSVHGITQAFLEDKPKFQEIVADFMDFIRGSELIIHNAAFDVGFIDAELQRIAGNWGSLQNYCRIVDSLGLARQLHVGQRNTLDALCRRYQIDNSKRELHGALLDAHLLAQVYLAMTGGQCSLFANVSHPDFNVKHVVSQVEIKRQAKNLRVLSASTDELAQHAAYLEMLKEKGKCIWVDS